MVSTESLIELRKQLPTSAAAKIFKRLIDKGIRKADGTPYSQSYIFRVLDPDQPEIYNEAIILEAISLRDEYLLHIAEIEIRILNPQV